jgi:hypothetical protein
MIIALCSLLVVAVVVFVLSVRKKDLPEPIPVSPFDHLDERKAAVYENLRDLQFEYRLGKMSDQDYQQAKIDLQKELAGVLADIDKLKAQIAPKVAVAEKAAPKKAAPSVAKVCPHCHAEFPKPMKFCGNCGKPMSEGAA